MTYIHAVIKLGVAHMNGLSNVRLLQEIPEVLLGQVDVRLAEVVDVPVVQQSPDFLQLEVPFHDHIVFPLRFCPMAALVSGKHMTIQTELGLLGLFD